MHFTADWFSHNIANWQRWLAEFRGRAGVAALEIGSYEGRSTVWLLQNILTGEGSTIDCCDLFDGEFRDRFTANTSPWANRVTIHQGASAKTLPSLAGSYDLAYIDGNHTPLGVIADAVLTWPLVKIGGIVIFDDYLWLPPGIVDPAEPWSQPTRMKKIARYPMEATKTGVDAFLAGAIGRFTLVEQGYQMAIRKTQ